MKTKRKHLVYRYHASFNSLAVVFTMLCLRIETFNVQLRFNNTQKGPCLLVFRIAFNKQKMQVEMLYTVFYSIKNNNKTTDNIIIVHVFLVWTGKSTPEGVVQHMW